MKTALLFVLLSLFTLDTQAQIRRHIGTGINPHSPTGQTTLVGVKWDRYVSKANDQEIRLEQIEKDRRAVTDEHLRLQTQLDGAFRSLSLDRKL